jgi:hypothetical protein
LPLAGVNSLVRLYPGPTTRGAGLLPCRDGRPTFHTFNILDYEFKELNLATSRTAVDYKTIKIECACMLECFFSQQFHRVAATQAFKVGLLLFHKALPYAFTKGGNKPVAVIVLVFGI